MSPSHLSRPLRAWITLPVACLIAFGAAAADTKSELTDLLALARRINPDVAVMRLEADAASARVDSAGAFDDPKFKIELMTPRDRPGDVSGELYQIRQMLPFWGKRAMRREIAEWDARKAYASVREVENQVAYRIKAAYAEYHAAHLALNETRKLSATLKRLADIASARYAQNAAPQADVTGANGEFGALTAELARIEAERVDAAARLNRLLGRASNTPLAAKPVARPVPPLKALDATSLTERARRGAPSINAALAGVASADGARRLAEREWYPDVELGLGVTRSDGRLEGYQAMVEFSLPLQWGTRRAAEREAAAMAGAARLRLDAVRLDLDADIVRARADLAAAVTRRGVVAKTTLPQSRIALDTAVKAYGLGRAEFPAVLIAEQALRRAVVESIEAGLQEQIALAEIERLVGEDL